MTSIKIQIPSTKHISSPTFNTCLQQITLKCHHFQQIVTITITTLPYNTVFHFHHSSLINTTLYLSSWQLLFYTVLGYCFIDQDSAWHQISLLSASDAPTHRRNCHPKKCIHTEPRDQSHFPFMTTFPQLVCLFKNLVNQVAIELGTWPMTEFFVENIWMKNNGSFWLEKYSFGLD